MVAGGARVPTDSVRHAVEHRLQGFGPLASSLYEVQVWGTPTADDVAVALTPWTGVGAGVVVGYARHCSLQVGAGPR